MRWKYLLLIPLIVLVGILFAAEFLAWRMIIIPERKHQDEEALRYMRDHLVEQMVVSSDGLQISSLVCHPNLSDSLEGRGSIVLLHGIGSSRGALGPQADYLMDLGYKVIIPDQRAHGSSEGEYCSFGYHERNDVSRILDALIEQGDKGPFGVYGISMGGSVAAMSLASEERLSFGIIQSTFADLGQIVNDYQRNMYGLSLPLLSSRALNRAGKRADFDPDEVSPLAVASEFEVPVFISHGTADEDISSNYSWDIFNAVQVEEKVFFPIATADHLNWWDVGGQEYKDALKGFLYYIVPMADS